jgi:alkylation response protein AidB-like acyl-CoA dehydrogenase
VERADGGAPQDPTLAALARRYCNMRKTTIYAGSNEIQRNIVAKQALGL